jgi:hypothetical protein
MNDAFLVRFLQRFGNLFRNGQRFFNRNRAALAPLGQRFTGNQFHHEKVAAIDLFQSVNRSDVGMIQRGQYSRFTLKSRNTFGIAAEGFR